MLQPDSAKNEVMRVKISTSYIVNKYSQIFWNATQGVSNQTKLPTRFLEIFKDFKSLKKLAIEYTENIIIR